MDMIKKMWPVYAILAICIVLLIVNEYTGIIEEKPKGPQTVIIETTASAKEPIVIVDDTIPPRDEDDAVKPVEDILTVDNCEDLAALLVLKNPDAPSVAEFAEKYKGCTIAFDAWIMFLNNHGDYKTRYDIMLYAGDYSETTVYGPNFKFEDVGLYDLGIHDLYLPDYMCAGRNIGVIAKVVKFDSNTGIFKLDPVEVYDR